MIPASTLAALPAFTEFFSWGVDIVDRLVSGQINDEQAEAEVRQRLVTWEDGLAAARGTIEASRRHEDEERKKLPREAPAGAPTPAEAPSSPPSPPAAPPAAPPSPPAEALAPPSVELGGGGE